jgi:hypothetical protein
MATAVVLLFSIRFLLLAQSTRTNRLLIFRRLIYGIPRACRELHYESVYIRSNSGKRLEVITSIPAYREGLVGRHISSPKRVATAPQDNAKRLSFSCRPMSPLKGHLLDHTPLSGKRQQSKATRRCHTPTISHKGREDVPEGEEADRIDSSRRNCRFHKQRAAEPKSGLWIVQAFIWRDQRAPPAYIRTQAM